jgi:hypothetical protein
LTAYQNQIPGYELWAATARTRVEEIRTTRGADEMAALNTATQAAVGSLTGRILHLEAQARAHEERHEVQMRAFADQQAQIIDLLQGLPNRIGDVVSNALPPPVPPPRLRAHRPIPRPIPRPVQPAVQQAGHEEEKDEESTPPRQAPPRQAPPRQAPPGRHEEEKDEETTPPRQAPPRQAPPRQAPPREAAPLLPSRVMQDAEPPLPTPRRLPPWQPLARAPVNNPLPADPPLNPAELARRRLAWTNAVALLRPTPRVPAIPAKLPPTWPALVGEWYSRDLESFVGVDTKEWGHTMKMRFHKRHMGILEIDNWARKLRLDPGTTVVRRQVAEHLEESRVEGLKLTLGQHIQVLRADNIEVLKRTSKRAAELEDDDTDSGI